jgi:hypothetical protein
VYCMARSRDVERCAFERANLIIGASDMVAMAQRNSHRMQGAQKASSTRHREEKLGSAVPLQRSVVRQWISPNVGRAGYVDLGL